jgi:hypothetical protein
MSSTHPGPLSTSSDFGEDFAWLNGKLTYEEIYVDILDAKMTPVSRPTSRLP